LAYNKNNNQKEILMILDINQNNPNEQAPQMSREQMMNAIRDAFANHATDLACEKCSNDTFNEVVKIKRLSAIASPTGEEMVLPFKVFICSKCSEPIPDMK
jgi:hypothetical protein